MAFIHRESIAHKTAKETLARWLEYAPLHNCDNYWFYPLRDGTTLAWRPNHGEPVFVEYPFTKDFLGYSPTWDEFAETPFYKGRCPTFDECVAIGHPPHVVADIALRHKGSIIAVIEVVHKNPPAPEKVAFYRHLGVSLYVVDASWVLDQIDQPDSLLLSRW